MRRTLLIFRNEVVTTLSRFSFWVGVLGIPLLGYLTLGIAILLGMKQAPRLSETLTQIVSSPQNKFRIGIVDAFGLDGFLPTESASYEFIPYAEEQAAFQALQAGEIQAYACIPADYLARGQVRYVQAELSPNLSDNPREHLEHALTAALMGSRQKARAFRNPLENQETISLAKAPQADIERNPWSYIVPYFMGMVFYLVTMGTSSTMLNSMSREKSNRTLETLLTAAAPQEILTGKIIALGLIGLFEAVFWFGNIYALVFLGASLLSAWMANIHLPLALLGWSLVLFILGYFFNASVMAVAGALADTTREASQVSMLVVLPSIIPLMLNAAIIESPHSTLALALSFIPPTAPLTLIMRMAATVIPWWQPVAASFLLALSDYLLIRGAAHIFHGQNLLSGGKMTFRRLAAVLQHK